MKISEIKARQILDDLKSGRTVEQIILANQFNGFEWNNFSKVAYQIQLEEEKSNRQNLSQSKRVVQTSNDEIQEIIALNSLLSGYALALHPFATKSDLNLIIELSIDLPNKLDDLIISTEEVLFDPRLRALQKKGRYEALPYFQQFLKIIEAATISHYRKNYISAYMTLMPVIEGVLIRWAGYNGSNKKVGYEQLRKFFANSHIRQPSPWNIAFHDVYCKVCFSIIDNHFFLPTTAGTAHGNFNRHIASHLLGDENFANRENSMRLFLLLDLMTEIFIWESKGKDPRMDCTNEIIMNEFKIYSKLQASKERDSPEDLLLNSNNKI
jgi:hypothetical protein